MPLRGGRCDPSCVQDGRSGNGTDAVPYRLRFASAVRSAARHVASIFVHGLSREMTRLYPVGSLPTVDQRPGLANGCTVVALVDNATIKMCAVTRRATPCFPFHGPRRTLARPHVDKRRVRTIGVVVFFQASHDMKRSESAFRLHAIAPCARSALCRFYRKISASSVFPLEQRASIATRKPRYLPRPQQTMIKTPR